jgi:hypothetical protein
VHRALDASGERYDQAILHKCFSSLAQRTAYAIRAPGSTDSFWRLDDKVDLVIAPSRVHARAPDRMGASLSERRSSYGTTRCLPAICTPSRRAWSFILGRLAVEKGVAGLIDALYAAGRSAVRDRGWRPSGRRVGCKGPCAWATPDALPGCGFPPDQVPGVSRAGPVCRGAPPSVMRYSASQRSRAMAAGRPVIATKMGGTST